MQYRQRLKLLEFKAKLHWVFRVILHQLLKILLYRDQLLTASPTNTLVKHLIAASLWRGWGRANGKDERLIVCHRLISRVI